MNVTVPLLDTPSLYFHNALSWDGLPGLDSEQELVLYRQIGSSAIVGPILLLEIFSSLVKK
jgi:hypothetical protein